MQNVAWAMTSEWNPKPTRNSNRPRSIVRENVFCRATPVTMPGRAIGRTNRNEYELRPKKRKRCMAKAASVPRTRAIAVAARATCTEFHSASRGPSVSHAWRHQSSVKPCGGHDSDVAVLNDRIATTASGR